MGPEEVLDRDDTRPNIILILADDMGYNDVSLHNGGAADGTLLTPHIDSLATSGVWFAEGYAANATCAPSRAAIPGGIQLDLDLNLRLFQITAVW